MTCPAPLKAPFPWFGGKVRARDQIWARFGDPANYVEPFAGSLAVLLGRPHAPRIETVNDLDCFLANFWRAIAADPEEVARLTDWPVNEADLHARHRWLVDRVDFRQRMRTDPEHFDAKIAAWWVWGLCAWIGSGWCSADPGERTSQNIPRIGGNGTTDASGGLTGIHGVTMRGPTQKLPNLGGTGSDHGNGIHSKTTRTAILDTFQALSARLRSVRVTCGDFERILSDSVTWRHGTTAILLDPEYPEGADVYAEQSAHEGEQHVWHRAARWAVEHGEDTRLRIALCGYAGTWTPPPGWTEVPWKAKGGYGGQRKEGKNENADRERIWFSPGCVRGDTKLQGDLFAPLETS